MTSSAGAWDRGGRWQRGRVSTWSAPAQPGRAWRPATEVEKIAAAAKRICPDRIQLNTVSRPPAEEFAHSIPAHQMTVFASLFDGKAEVICGERAGESQPLASPAVTDGDILALLSRRPGTAQGVSAGLGLHIAEATKRLQSPLEQEHLSTLRRNNTLFYRTKPAT